MLENDKKMLLFYFRQCGREGQMDDGIVAVAVSDAMTKIALKAAHLQKN